VRARRELNLEHLSPAVDDELALAEARVHFDSPAPDLEPAKHVCTQGLHALKANVEKAKRGALRASEVGRKLESWKT
jgi:hypothetical protein